MVKVYKCHNFQSQNVVQVDGEPVAVYNYRDKLFVATDKRCIEVFLLGSSILKFSSFSSTESTVHNIVYSSPGNYVATIESSRGRKAKTDVFSVKVYLNWEIGTGDIGQKTSVREAGKDQSPTNLTVDSTCIQVIDVRHNGQVEDFDVCQKTGNLVTVAREETQIYQLVEKTIVNSSKVYLDIVLFLKLEWHIGYITKTVLCEDYIGVLAKKEIHVVRVIYSDDNYGRSQTIPHEGDSSRLSVKGFGNQNRKTSSVTCTSNVSLPSSKGSLCHLDTPLFSRIGYRSSANASPSLSLTKSAESYNQIKEDENFTKVNLDDLKSSCSQSSNSGVKSIYLKRLWDSTLDKVVGPDITDLRGGGHQTAGQIQVITVYHQKTKRIDEEFIHLQLIPSYISNINRLTTRVGATPLRSVVYNSLVGLCLMVSTEQRGHLYDIWSSSALCLSTYSYSDIPKQIVMNDDLLYVLTDRGLEVYTSRCGAAAVHHTERFNTKEKAFPPAEMETCLCGVHLFMNTAKLEVGENFVIVMSKLDGVHKSDKGVCSLYALEKCLAEELYKDMVKYGERCRKLNEATYLNLLLEGHMALRNNFIGGDIPEGELGKLFRESCLLIGEFYARESSPDRMLCIPYLTMSGLGEAELIRKIVDSHDESGQHEYGQGFIAYLKHALLEDGEPFELIEAEGEAILTVCSKAIPDQLSEVILFSRIKEFSAEHAWSLLEAWIKKLESHGEKSSVTDKLALSILNLNLCDVGAAERSLSLISKADMIKVLTEHHEILHENFQQLSPISQLMRQCCPSVLTQSLVALHDKGTISLDLAVQLLQGNSPTGDLHKNNHVKEYLEFLLSDIHRRYIFDEAVVILAEIYIKRLLDLTLLGPKQRTAPGVLYLPIDEGHFGQRFGWLDHLPPFKGPEEIKGPCQYILRESPTTARKNATKVKQHISADRCHCGLCYEDLIRLQSLLCSNIVGESLLNKMSDMLKEDKLVPGQDSLLLLMLLKKNRKQAAELMVANYPALVTEYGKCVMFADNEQKKILLDCMFTALQQQIKEPDSREPDLLKSLKEILEYLAKSTEPEDFLQLLPDNGNFLYFLPYITMNMKHQKAQNLLNSIKDRGRRLQSAMLK